MTLNSNNFNNKSFVIDEERGLASQLGGMFAASASGFLSRDAALDNGHDSVSPPSPFVS